MPLASITTPGGGKRLYLDPRMLPLLEGRRVALIDDVISSGSSICAALTLLALIGCTPVAIGAAMLQTGRWRAPLAGAAPGVAVESAFATPLLRASGAGWIAES